MTVRTTLEEDERSFGHAMSFELATSGQGLQDITLQCDKSAREDSPTAFLVMLPAIVHAISDDSSPKPLYTPC